MSNNGDNTVSEIDTSTNTVVATIHVGSGPEGVAVTPDGTRLYVANDGGAVWVINTSNNSVVAKVTVGGDPYGVAITPDGTRVYVTEDNGAAVSAIDTSSNTVIAKITVPATPSGVVISPDGRHAYVASDGASDAASVSVIDTSSNTVVATVGLAGLPWGIAVTPDGTRVYVANSVPTISGGSARVSVIDTSSNAVVANVAVGAGLSWGLAITPDGTRAYVATGVLIGSGANSGVVSVIDTSSNTVIATVAVADPLGLAVTPDGSRVYVANDFNFSGASSVSVIDTSSNTVVATVGVGGIPEWVAIANGSGSAPPPQCTYSLSSAGEVFVAAGGIGSIGITAPAGCAWNVAGAPNWIAFTGSTSGSGNGMLSYHVSANAGNDLSATMTVAGMPFTVEEEAASISGLALIGSMPHIAAEENWITTFTMVNHAISSNQARLSLFGSNIDASGSGNPLQLPLSFPQQPGLGSLLGASLDNTLAPFASWIVGTTEATAAPVQTGSAQALGTGDLSGFAIFHRISDNQEAVVPLTPGTPNAPWYLLSFDNTGGIVTAVAVANVSPQAASIGYIVRNDAGAQIASGSLALPGSGQISFDLPAANGFPATVGIRGTVEFDTPAGGQISVLGIRNTPQVTASGTVTTLTTVPALANVGTGGGSFAFIASGGDGWQTTFVLVNAGSAAAPVSLRFLDPNGNASPLPISYPQQGGPVITASSITPTLAAGATLLVQSTGAVNLLTGSAQLATTGNVSGFVIFRHNGQEAVVPMESRNAPAYILAFDNTSGTATGIALNNVSSAAAAVNIPVVVRDDQGNQLATHTLTVAANGDFSGDLGQYSATLGAVLFPETANIRGTVEFDVPSRSVQIGVIGIRTPAALTYTSLPALMK